MAKTRLVAKYITLFTFITDHTHKKLVVKITGDPSARNVMSNIMAQQIDKETNEIKHWLKDRPIVLVGMMGVGKTTIGRRLAKEFGLKFTDCDQAIEKAAGMTISDIFVSFGEAEFRAGERRVISRLIKNKSHVIATGGGAFMDASTRKLIKKSAVSIWLDSTISTLVERTGKRDTRPLLRSGNRQAILEDLYKKRCPYYVEANLRVESGNGPHSHVVTSVKHALHKFLTAENTAEQTQKTGPDHGAHNG